MPKQVKKVRVVVKATGKEQVVPAHWLENPRIAEGFEVSKASRGARQAEGSTEAKSTVKEK